MKCPYKCFTAAAIVYAAVCSSFMSTETAAADSRGVECIHFGSFSAFDKSHDTNSGATMLTSPKMASHIHWNEMIVSWNIVLPTNASMTVQSKLFYPGYETQFYTMGRWSTSPSQQPRESIPGQKDSDGEVLTDTLALKHPANRFQLRITVSGEASVSAFKFLSVTLLDNRVTNDVLQPNHAAWGKTIPVPERSQMVYEDGEKLCSPATVSMLLAFWGQTLNRPELDRSVPEIAKGVFDPNWPGMGNWSFNMAYAGSLPGMRAYVTRFTDVSELEDWIAAGIPVGISLCYNRLRGKSLEPSGHIVVCCGFSKNGDVIVNDPGTSQNVRKTFPRANLTDAWSYSRNTVYLIYPVNQKLPPDRFGHWASP